MPPKKKKEEAPDDLGLPADGQLPIRGPEDALRQLKERSLMDRVSSLELQNRALLKRAESLKASLDEVTSEQGDVYIYLHKKLDENFEVIAGLERRVEELESENEGLRESAKKQLSEVSQSADYRISLLEREKAQLRQELDNLEDFRLQREAYVSEIERLKRLLEEEKDGRMAEVTDLERRSVAAKERLKTEMFNKIKETKKSILLATKDQLHYTVKRTMAENEQMTTELTFQSKETERILELNSRLSRENSDLKRDCELLQESQSELIKRTQFFQKLVKKLNESIARQEEKERVIQETGVKSTSHHKTAELEQLVSSLKREVLTLSERCKELEQRAHDAVAMAADARQREDAVVALQDDTVKFLLSAVDSLRQQIRHAADASPDLLLSGLSPQDKLKAVDMLLVRLQVYESAISANPYRQAAEGEPVKSSTLPRLHSSGNGNPSSTTAPSSSLQEAISKGRTAGSTVASSSSAILRKGAVRSVQSPSVTSPSLPPSSLASFTAFGFPPTEEPASAPRATRSPPLKGRRPAPGIPMASPGLSVVGLASTT